jgi:adenylate cyclase
MINELNLHKILIVDDETANLRLLERLFRGSYEVITAPSGPVALDLLNVHDVSLIISDQRMPGMTGIEFLKRAAEMRPQTVRIMLTGYSDAEALVEAINSGSVYKYLTKPWVNEELFQTAKRALQHYETMRGQRQLQITNERLQSRLRSMKGSLLSLAVEVLRDRDHLIVTRSVGTRELAMQVGRALNIEPHELEAVSAAAYLYEAALIVNSAGSIGRATGNSNGIEASLKILAEMPEFEDVFALLQYSAERHDGSGIPNGFQGDEIPIGARIIAVAYEFQRLLHRGPHIKQLSPESIADHLMASSGSSFDPAVVDALCRNQSHVARTEISKSTLTYA